MRLHFLQICSLMPDEHYFKDNLVVILVVISLQDDRFNHDIDARTGYKTQTLLCMPIKDFNGDVIGVAQVSVMKKWCIDPS